MLSVSLLDDHARVILGKVGNNPGSDYINASYIDVGLEDFSSRIYNSIVWFSFSLIYFKYVLKYIVIKIALPKLKKIACK